MRTGFGPVNIAGHECIYRNRHATAASGPEGCTRQRLHPFS
jgi:hypothetical protein